MKSFSDPFSKVILLVIFIIILLIGLFVYLGSLRSNYIRIFEITGGTDNVSLVNPIIRVKFSRPVQRENINSQIIITPEVEFTTNFSRNDLEIRFPMNLDSSTTYTISFSGDILDIYGEKFGEEIEYEFRTKEQRIAYLKKGLFGEDDRIIESDLKFETHTELYSAKRIKDFEKNSEYLVVVVVNEDETQNIKVKNLRNGTENDFKLNSQNVISIDLNEDKVLFISQKVEPRSNFLIPQGQSTTNLFNISSGELRLFNPKDTGIATVFANFTSDGRSVVYKSEDSFFYIADINEGAEPVGIGRFQTTGGFNRNLDKIVLTEFDPLEVYTSFPFITIFSSDRTMESITDGSVYVIDPKFYNNSDEIIFAQKYQEIEGSTGFFEIRKFLRGDFETIFKFENYSLEIPQLSFDDRFLVAERYSSSDLLDYQNQRDFFNFRKPIFGDLVTFDMQSKEVIGICDNCIEAQFLN